MNKERIDMQPATTIWLAATMLAMMGACMLPLPAPTPYCGDSVVNTQDEQCDEGVEDTATCNSDCKAAECGDGHLNSVAGEQCDAGEETSECDRDCTIPKCGDLVVNAAAGEKCDEGGVDTAMCNRDCTVAECGDGRLNSVAGELCDAGEETPECDRDCTIPKCGDGLLNMAAGEACDEGVMDTAGCDRDCTAVICGDGHHNGAAEDCDPGQGSSTCDSDCTEAACGDGLVNVVAGEECDDADQDDSDECLTSCEFATCDDGIRNHDEVDVDCGGPCVECWSETGAQLATGRSHTCALTRAGTVRCWGLGANGRLGYGNVLNIGDDEIAAAAGDVDVGGLVRQLAAGGSHTCALLVGGAVRCWGKGRYGRLGYGNENDIGDEPGETPATAGDVDVGGQVVQLALGEDHTCALLDRGAVRCWGYGDDGQLGYGSMSNIGDREGSTPATARDVDVDGRVVQIVAGVSHTCALLDTGAVRCWGKNEYGQLGYGEPDLIIGDDETPATTAPVNVGGLVVELAAGGYHTCALLDTGAVRCWGRNDHGQLGRGRKDEIRIAPGESTDADVDVGGVVAELAAGGHHTCALLGTGAVRCWGLNDEYQLGYGHKEDIGDEPGDTPAAAGDVNMGGSVFQLAAGRRHTCARLVTGAVRCWGTGMEGQLGYGTPDDRRVPIPALVGDVPFQ